MATLDLSSASCAVHPESPAAGACEHCGAFACPACLAPEAGRWLCGSCRSARRGRIHAPPWEQRSEIGLGTALWENFQLVLKQPEKTLGGLDPRGPVSSLWLLLYCSLLPASVMNGVMGLGFNKVLAAWNGPQAELPGVLGLLQDPWLGFLFGITLGPLLAPFWHMLSGTLHHLVLLVLGGGKSGLRATIRVSCHAATLNAIGVIPLAGLVAWILVMIWQARGYAAQHEMPIWKGAIAVVAPICVLFCLGLGLAMAFAGVLLGSGALENL